MAPEYRQVMLIAAVLVLAACAPRPTAQGVSPATATAPAVSEARRTLVISVRAEPQSVAQGALQQAGVTLGTSKRLFNAQVAVQDHTGAWIPYLVESLPRLNTDAWRVDAGGRMTTTYRIKPNVVWHDGQPLTASDFAFGHQVYSTPDLGTAGAVPTGAIEAIGAPDERTVVVTWRRPYAEAWLLGSERNADFGPLPRHILSDPFREGNIEAFTTNPYWNREFVGLGPYRLDRWEPGAFIEGVAFDRHILGRPRIERVKLVFISDAASLLSGDVHFAADDSIRFEQSLVLRQEWGSRGGGGILSKPSLWRGSYFQFRPEIANPRAILDVRVRRAFAHAVDRHGLNDGLFEGHNIIADTIVPPSVDFYGDLDRAITKYPYDVRRTEQLMREAGFTRTGGGPFAGADGRPVSFEIKTNSATQQEQEQAILGNGWRTAGFDIQETILPAAQAQDSQVRASFPSIFTFSSPQGDVALARLNSSLIPRPDNRWTGNNRGGWISADFDRYAESFSVALDPGERVRHVVEMARLFTEDVPAISLYFNAIPIAFASTLQGPRESVPDAEWAWNVHEWELR